MKFYFCETCGKRLTEHDIEGGVARNKKLKGVYCRECAIGVTTMETLPVSDEDARKLLRKTSGRRLPARDRPTPGEKRASDRVRSPGERAALTADASTGGLHRLGLGVGVGLAVAVLVGLVLAGSGPDAKKNPQPAKNKRSAVTEPDVAVAAPVSPEGSGKSPNHPAAPPEEGRSDVQVPDAKQASPDLEDRDTRPNAGAIAAEEWNKVKRFSGLEASDREARIKRVETFLSEHEKSEAGAEALKLLAELKTGRQAELKRKAEEQAKAEQQRLAELRKQQAHALGEHIADWGEALKTGDWTRARDAVSKIQTDEGLGAFKAAGPPALAATKALEAKVVARVAALRERIGKTETILFTGMRKPILVKIVGVNDGSVTARQTFTINGREKLGKERTWPLTKISEQSWKRFRPEKGPESESGWMLVSLSSWLAKDSVRMAAALEKSGSGPLVDPLRRELRRLRMGEREFAAGEAFKVAEAYFRGGKWKEAIKAYEELEEKHGKTRFIAGQAKDIEKHKNLALFRLFEDPKYLKEAGTKRIQLELPRCFDFLSFVANGKPCETKEVEPYLVFNVTVGKNEIRTFQLKNVSKEARSWSIKSTVPWLQAQPPKGRLSGGASVEVALRAAPPDQGAARHESLLAVFEENGELAQRIRIVTHVIPPYVRPAGPPQGKPAHLAYSKLRVLRHLYVKGRLRSVNTFVGAGTSEVYELDIEGRGFTGFYTSVRYITPPFEGALLNFEIHVDGKLRMQTGLISPMGKEERFLLVDDLAGAKRIALVVRPARPEAGYKSGDADIKFGGGWAATFHTGDKTESQ